MIFFFRIIQDEEWRKKEVDWRMEMLVLQKQDEELCQLVEQLNEVEL